jgi:hypothetical protein
MPKSLASEAIASIASMGSVVNDERSRDVSRKRAMRAAGAEVAVGRCQNRDRRAECLEDPRRFLRCYFPDRFYNPFASHHLEMIYAIATCAADGGDQAIAAPRGDGKTEICSHMIIWCILRELVRFPVIVAATGDFAEAIFRDIKGQFENNDLLREDFPEVCDPIRDLEGAPQRAGKQHIQGEPTRIVWTQKALVFPKAPGSPYGGVSIAYKGLDAAIRGIKIRGQRPDFVLIDDPETRESARSEHQIRERTIAIERDIAGLGGPDKTLSRVILTTLQNRQSLSYTFTDPNQKPSWHGKRFAMMQTMPSNTDMWTEYVALWQNDQKEGTTTAEDYYLANREAMDAGAVVSNPYRYKPGEHSAIQSFYNSVAKNGWDSVNAELQNDPADDAIDDQSTITAHTVRNRMSGLRRAELPKESETKIVAAIDIGKYWSHWVKVVMYGHAIGHVIDYGVMETNGLAAGSDEQSVEQAILKSLEQWRIDTLSTLPPDICFVDSGDYTSAVYEFIRRSGAPFVASKGWEAGRMRFDAESTPTKRIFQECAASLQTTERLWLYNFNASFWKAETHRRFTTATYNEANLINNGSLSVWSTTDNKEHMTYSHHIVAEIYEERFVQGKGLVKKWVARHRNNHWLDATAMALAAGGCLGFRTIPAGIAPTQPSGQAYQKREATETRATPNRFQQRSGGWLKGMKR